MKTEQRLPFEAINQQLLMVRGAKACLHPEAARQVCDKIVLAHSVQRSAVLEKIIGSTNHVGTFFPPELDTRNEVLRLHALGWRDASTFTGFCAKHDNSTFAPIEKSPFIGTDQQNFLIAYRALCYEIFQKSTSLKASSVTEPLLVKGATKQGKRIVNQVHAAFDRNVAFSLNQLLKLKARMDKHLVSGDYSGFSSVS